MPDFWIFDLGRPAGRRHQLGFIGWIFCLDIYLGIFGLGRLDIYLGLLGLGRSAGLRPAAWVYWLDPSHGYLP